MGRGRGGNYDINRCRSSINTFGLVDMRYLDIYFTCPGGRVVGRAAVYDEIKANSVQLNRSWDWTELGKIMHF